MNRHEHIAHLSWIFSTADESRLMTQPPPPHRFRWSLPVLLLIMVCGTTVEALAQDVITERPLGYVRATYRTRVVTADYDASNPNLTGASFVTSANTASLTLTSTQGLTNPGPPAGNGLFIDPAVQGQATVSASWTFPSAMEGMVNEFVINSFFPTGQKRLVDLQNREAVINGATASTMTRMPGYTGDIGPPTAALWLNRHLVDYPGLATPNALSPYNQTFPPAIGQGSSGSSSINLGIAVPVTSYVSLNPGQADQLVIELRAGTPGHEIIVKGIYDLEITPIARLRSWTGDIDVHTASGSALPEEQVVPDMFLFGEMGVTTGLGSTAILEVYDESYVFGTPANGNLLVQKVTLQELTFLTVEQISRESGEDQVRTRLWLKAGQVSAEIPPNAGGPQSDFAIKTPTATCSVRGTIFSMGYFPAFGPHEEVMFVNLTQGGPVTIDPVDPNQPDVELQQPGDSVRVATSGVTGGYREETKPVIPGYLVQKYLNFAKPVDEIDIRAGGMAMNAAGQLIILDYNDAKLWRVTPPSTTMTELATLPGGSGEAWVGPVMRPDGKAVLANRMTGEIIEVSSTGTITTLAPTGPQRVNGVALKADGTLLAPAHTPGVIHAVETDGDVLPFLESLQDPSLPVVTSAGRVFYMDRTATDRLYEAAGAPVAATALGTAFATDRVLAFNHLGSLGLVCAHGPLGKYGQTELLTVEQDTGARAEIGRRFSQPISIVGDPATVFYVCDTLAGAVFKATKIPPSTPAVDAGAAKMGFGSVLVNSTTQRIVTLVNVGTADLQLLSAASTNPAYTIAAPGFPLTLTPGQETQLLLNFNPTTGGAFAGVINVQTNDPAMPVLAIDLAGEVVVPTVTSVEPSNALPGEFVTARLINVGTADAAIHLFVNGVEVTNVVIDRSQGAQAIFALPATLPPGQVANISVVENGLSAAAFPYQVAPGTGAHLLLDVSTTNGLNFGGVPAGRSLDLPLPLLNRGSALLTVSDAQVPFGFQVISPPRPFDIAAGDSASLMIRFAPPAGGFFQGNLQLFSNSASGSPLSAFMFGRTVADAEAAWRTAQFGAESGNASIAGPLADLDGDGIVNLLERALGGNPLSSGGFTPVAPSAPAADGSVTVTVLVDTSAEDTVAVLEHSPDLATWTLLASYYPQGVPAPMRTARTELRLVSQTAVSGGPVWQFTERLLRGGVTVVPGFFRIRVIGPQ